MTDRVHRIYSIAYLRPFINWAYFYYAWGIREGMSQAEELRGEAERLMNHLSLNGVAARAVFVLYPAYSDGDDIVLDNSSANTPSSETSAMTLRFLRQQHAKPDEPCRCLSDFIAPKGYDDPTHTADHLGLFATTVDERFNRCPCCNPIAPKLSEVPPQTAAEAPDPYATMLRQTVLDRLAEAAAEVLHLEVRKRIWGFSPDENLPIEELHTEKFQGIRPAVGYPSLPDQSFIFDIAKLLPLDTIGITLTENGMMMPHASTCGLIFAHPQSHYFAVGPVSNEQLNDYARRRNCSAADLRKYLPA